MKKNLESKGTSGKLGNDPIRFVPQLFTQQVYAATTVKQLIEIATGIFPSAVDPYRCTVNISPARGNKPTTIEFRQHYGTLDPTTIKWWASFLCTLVKYAYFLAQIGFEVRDTTDLDDVSVPKGWSFTMSYHKRKSILDVIGFPEEGKSFFARMKKRV